MTDDREELLAPYRALTMNVALDPFIALAILRLRAFGMNEPEPPPDDASEAEKVLHRELMRDHTLNVVTHSALVLLDVMRRNELFHKAIADVTALVTESKADDLLAASWGGRTQAVTERKDDDDRREEAGAAGEAAADPERSGGEAPPESGVLGAGSDDLETAGAQDADAVEPGVRANGE